MKKKTVSVLLTVTMAAGLLAGCGGNSSDARGIMKLTLYSINTTDPDFDEWQKNVEDATG